MEIMAVKPNGKRRDIDNIIKPISDLLVRMNIVSDDSEMVSVTARWVPAEKQGTPCKVFVFAHDGGV